MSLDFSTFSSDVNADLAIPILRQTSCTHLPSDGNMLPRYMKLFTYSKLVPCIVMLHVGMTVDFENTMVKDLDPFRYNPLFSLSCTTMSISCRNSSYVSAIVTVSSAYLKFLITVPPTLKPPFPLMFLMIISVYNANICGEATQPCQMPCLMFTDSLTSPLCLTAAC